MIPEKESQQGHRHHGKLDFDRRNINLQCVRCNKYLSGNLGNYERRQIEEHGIKWVKRLEIDAARHPGYSINDLEKIMENWKFQEIERAKLT